jgi:hypothetical protein
MNFKELYRDRDSLYEFFLIAIRDSGFIYYDSFYTEAAGCPMGGLYDWWSHCEFDWDISPCENDKYFGVRVKNRQTESEFGLAVPKYILKFIFVDNETKNYAHSRRTFKKYLKTKKVS